MKHKHIRSLWLTFLCALAYSVGIAADVPKPLVTSTNKVSAKKLPQPLPSPSSLTTHEPTNAAVVGDFAIVALPDTQFYTAASNGPLSHMFAAQTEWIISNRVSRNIAYVTLEGDISNNGNTYEDQWRRATNA